MRRLTLPLLSASYLSLSLIIALTLWRNGGGWGAGVAGLIGGLALCFTFHGLIGRALEVTALRKEMEDVRQAHRILIDQMERVDARVAQVLETIAEDATRRSDELTSEVHILEDLVQRMSDRLEERMTAAPSAASIQGRGALHQRQSAALLETVREALTENRVDLYLQPVVNLPQRKTVFYESYSRLRDASGRVMMPAEYLAVAEPEGLMTVVDNLLLFRCVQIVRRLAKTDKKVGIFCNISTASLGDETFFPQFLELLSSNRDLSGALIFELGQAAYDARDAVQARNMGKLADLGFRFSLDKITDLDLDFQDLARSDVKFVKIGAQFLLDELEETADGLILRALPDLAAEDFAALTRRYGVDLIVEKIEHERQVVDVLELDIAYGQGHLFGEPRPIRDAVLAETDPPAGFMRGPTLSTGTTRRRA
jgi:cyclic-di-GMP phosphodiesterase TipF (flagellum assembly factor)